MIAVIVPFGPPAGAPMLTPSQVALLAAKLPDFPNVIGLLVLANDRTIPITAGPAQDILSP